MQGLMGNFCPTTPQPHNPTNKQKYIILLDDPAHLTILVLVLTDAER